ncbi:hypothetical protein BLNAU_6907 [Blattamonas nauphoetae]|uniref:Uncharacterized protein n=1 Tax=Blattamonas nauphoetae TaxID=2049346 RepID=A0ABQ9Y388_9EUKA|nr:hypothetical protein BLNAU_6907 [Blattamonas nauphoetae]
MSEATVLRCTIVIIVHQFTLPLLPISFLGHHTIRMHFMFLLHHPIVSDLIESGMLHGVNLDKTIVTPMCLVMVHFLSLIDSTQPPVRPGTDSQPAPTNFDQLTPGASDEHDSL